MLSKSWCVVLAVLGLAAFEVNGASASGGGANVSRAGGSSAGCRLGNGSCRGQSGQFPRDEHGVFCPTWGCGNAFCGWGGAGYGLGYGYVYSGWGYQLEGVPYFAQFPPVYYGYADNMPIVKASIRSSWAASESPQPVAEPAAIASPSSPPLRIINPYYVEAKADKP